jgi:hypothetical protein
MEARADHAADADEIINMINRPKQWRPEKITMDWGEEKSRTDTPIDQKLPFMDLPGFGSELEDCGDDLPRFCECCGETVTVGRTCRRSTCPRCARAWNLQAATRLTAKLEAVWAYQYTALKHHPYYHHVTISPPEDWALDGDPETVYWRTLDVVKDICEELGLAGVPIYHPYRGSEEEPGDDLGEWKRRIYADREWSDVRDELEFSPHFHVLGVSPHVDISVTEKIERETGWVIHRITQPDSNVSIGNSYDLARAAAYCLSHAGIYTDSNGDKSAAYHPRVSERVPEGTPTPNESTETECDKIVRAVAPRVLDVDYQEVACTASVPVETAAENGVSLAAGSVSGSGSSSGSSSDGGEQGDGGDGSGAVKCEGRMLHISRAPGFFNDPDWRERAIASDHLERRYREWKRREGLA